VSAECRPEWEFSELEPDGLEVDVYDRSAVSIVGETTGEWGKKPQPPNRSRSLVRRELRFLIQAMPDRPRISKGFGSGQSFPRKIGSHRVQARGRSCQSSGF